jgi:hypothetical protein
VPHRGTLINAHHGFAKGYLIDPSHPTGLHGLADEIDNLVVVTLTFTNRAD